MSEPTKAVFLSYASQDAEAAKRIADALRASGVEVWFDQSELVGGDQWDAKIRGQIGSCALFMPIISANTQARREGYFRIEWKLAAQRTHAMADGTPFLLPLLIDGTRDADALVPAEFRAVQFTKLPGGDAPEKFCARVKKLLGGEEPVGAASRRDESGPKASPAKASRGPAKWRWALPIFGVTMALLLVLKESRKEPAPPPAVSTPASVALLSEAQKLVEQARKVYENGDELDRENLLLAEDLVKRALALDPAEPSAWELGARLSYSMVWFNYYNTEARRGMLQQQAARARALAPQSVSALLVFADAQLALAYSIPTAARNHEDLSVIERDMLALAAREPENWRVQLTLGQVYRFSGRRDESLRSFQRALELSGGDATVSADLVNVLLRRKEMAEAESVVASALARHPTGRLRLQDVNLKIIWRSDLAGARAALATWPSWILQSDRGAFLAWQVWLWSRQPEKALAVAQGPQRDYLRDSFFSGPRAVLTARAHELAGHTEAARTDWRTVVQLADRELTTAPEDSAAIYWKAWALARLGDESGAKAIGAQLQQRNLIARDSFFSITSIAPLWVTLGQLDLAVDELRTRSANNADNYAVTRAMLELDPAYEPLRSDPRYSALLEATLAPAQKFAVAPAKADDKSTPADKSVAVLAFADMSADKGSEYFADGISEELLNVLAKVPGLKVSARTSAFYFKGKEVPVPEIAKQLGVAYVVEGSVRKQGDKVRITAQLIKADDGFHVWSENFDRDLKDIFAVQDEIAGRIAKELSLKLGVSSAASKAAVNPAALELYMRARQAWNLRTPQGFVQADEALNRAIALAPNFAQAYALLAQTWTTRDAGGSIGPFDQRTSPAFTRIQSQIDHALALAPNLAEAHTAQGNLNWHRWKFADAERELRLAIALNPNDATAHQYLGRVLLTVGRLDEGDAALQRAADLDPLSHSILDNRAFPLRFAGRFAESLAFEERALALQPDALQPNWLRATDLSLLGRHDEAVARLRRLPLDGTNGAAPAIGVFVRAGLRAEAEQRLAGVTAERKFVALAHLGRYEEMLAALDPAKVRASLMQSVLFEPQYDPIRSDPRFVNFLAILGMTEAHARAQVWRKASSPQKVEAKK